MAIRKLNDEELKTLERLGENFMSKEDCAKTLELDSYDFLQELRNKNSDAHKAYYRGFLKRKLEVRESIMEVALRGSNPAQVQVLKFIEQAEKENG